MASSANDPDQEPAAQGHAPDEPALEILLADSWQDPLWKRLLGHLKDRITPENLPPLRLSSRPVDVGMLASDRLGMPWFRTVFTNVGDVISPETLPPLELESAPMDVGELIADQMAHPWWTSLLRNLADVVAPERQPALQLTSHPMDPGGLSDSMALPRWSATISTPKVFLPDQPKPEYAPVSPRPAPSKPKPSPAEIEFVHVLQADLKRDLRRSALRQKMWISLAVLEVAALLGSAIWWK